MAELWKGAPVAARLQERAAALAEQLRARGVTPTLALVRVGDSESDLAYERGAMNRCAACGVAVRSVTLSENAGEAALLSALRALDRDEGVHGILLFRPLPAGYDEKAACEAIDPGKDVDGVTAGSLAGVFTGSGTGFAPCTARGVMELLRYYEAPLAGASVVVAGRSLVVGRPLAMLLGQADATVTLCHSRTRDLPALARQADIFVAAVGKKQFFGTACFAPGQIVVDVGIHYDEAAGRMVGDVRTEEAAAIAAAVTPVPGGVGAVTTAVLALHTTEAAMRLAPF